MAVKWDDETAGLMAPSALEFALVYATSRQHVSAYRPQGGQWRLVLMAPLGMPDALLLELARPHLSAEEAQAVEQALR